MQVCCMLTECMEKAEIEGWNLEHWFIKSIHEHLFITMLWVSHIASSNCSCRVSLPNLFLHSTGHCAAVAGGILRTRLAAYVVVVWINILSHLHELSSWLWSLWCWEEIYTWEYTCLANINTTTVCVCAFSYQVCRFSEFLFPNPHY